MSTRPLLLLSIWTLLASSGEAQRNYPPKLEEAKPHVYKTVGDTSLSLYVFQPKDWQATDQRPAIVFFFGGGWQNGTPEQFEQQCRYLAARGMVAITADYRVASRHRVKAIDCVRDAMSAIRWVRGHAAELGIAPDRIAVGGGSAGGHLAACTGVISDVSQPGESTEISPRADALVLFNPAVSFNPAHLREAPGGSQALSERMGVDPKELSPADHVASGAPPTLILIGTKDFLLAGNRHFVERMKSEGNRCELDLYEGAAHGFFNFGRGDNSEFLKTTESMDRFLASLGYLQGPPTVREFFAK